MKHLNRWMSWGLALLMLGSMVVLPGAGYAETDSDSNTVYFEPALIHLLDISIGEFTETEDMRALFAFLLSVEFSNQVPDSEFDYTQPIYVALNELGLASAALGLKNGYVCIFYSNLTDPVIAAYCVSEGLSSFAVKQTLEIINDSVWEVSTLDYLEQGKAVSDAFNN